MPKGKRRPIKRPAKAPSAPVTLVAFNHQAPPPNSDDPEAGQFDESFKNIPTGKRLRRERFCQEYLLDFNGTNAVRRMGYQSKTPWVMASEWLNEPYTQWYLAQLMAKVEEKAIFTRSEILLGLKREANYFGMDGGAAARIAALRTAAKICGFEIQKVEADVNFKGGVMLIPATGTVEDWEKAAAKAQEQLKKDVRT